MKICHHTYGPYDMDYLLIIGNDLEDNEQNVNDVLNYIEEADI